MRMILEIIRSTVTKAIPERYESEPPLDGERGYSGDRDHDHGGRCQPHIDPVTTYPQQHDTPSRSGAVQIRINQPPDLFLLAEQLLAELRVVVAHEHLYDPIDHDW